MRRNIKIKIMKTKIKTFFVLHIMLMVYSMSGIFSKLASRQDFMSISFCFYYGLIIVFLGIYAVGWQQIIKRLPLTTAFANKAITVVWGIIWGMIFFHEMISWTKILGAVCVMSGVMIFARSDGDEVRNE